MPQRNSRRLRDLVRDTQVTVQSQQGGWLNIRVKLGNETLTGFVSQELVKFVSAGTAEIPRPANHPVSTQKTVGQFTRAELTTVARQDNTRVHSKYAQLFTPENIGPRIFLGEAELLSQNNDGKLYYLKLALYASGARFGKLYNYRFEVVTKTPLDEYESRLREQVNRENWLRRSSGRIEQTSIILELLLTAYSVYKATTPLGRAVTIGVFILDLFLSADSGSSSDLDSIQNSAQSEVIKKLWEAGLRKFKPMNKEWVIELVTYGAGKLLGGAQGETKKDMTDAMRRLESISAFRWAISDKTWLYKLNSTRINLPLRQDSTFRPAR